MSALSILKEGADLGVTVRLEGEKLKIAARAKPSECLLEKLRTHKAEIVAHLQGGSQDAPEPDPVELEERAAMAARDGSCLGRGQAAEGLCDTG